MEKGFKQRIREGLLTPQEAMKELLKHAGEEPIRESILMATSTWRWLERMAKAKS